MDKKIYLLQKIEMCRNKMITLSNTNDLTSDAVIAASVELDHLLNELNKLKTVSHS
ncbi:aspartyl-phosphate phosphatase Spo0E family protein [Aquibacillus salsiterrae]|uniref:Aspartyl-phosphate phosphatase Spo0E family protein n=1 Tax=Aquibacillus salsiterrae TaxID=2950439 RepID=A0A9X4AGD7_9BACI|nr:aspartyl-phosphate phosphatase Spo0E family protein [Aquibacillus salsiterrae]MDC3417175.1 aspartyl-phosphate phosphatase Spo0E family protein [Aquibacillus salsiterrae]